MAGNLSNGDPPLFFLYERSEQWRNTVELAGSTNIIMKIMIKLLGVLSYG